MKKSRHRWILTVLRFGLCAAAIIFLILSVSWYDKVTLQDGTKVRLLSDDGDTLLIEQDGAERTVKLDEVVSVDVAGRSVAEVEPGIAGVVKGIDHWYAIWAILIFLPVPLLQSLRLVWMLAVQDVRLSYWNAMKLTYAGNFFNFALPGTTGGDLIKAYYITRFPHHKTEAVTTVFLDRVIGLLGLVTLAGTMIILTWNPERFGALAIVIAVVCGGLAMGALFVFSERLRNAIGLPRLAAKLPMGDQLLRVGRATVEMRRHKTLIGLSLLNTIALQFIVMVSAFVMSRALDMDGKFSLYLIYVPFGFLISAIPISPPQAFGVMEWAYIGFFVGSGLDNAVSQAVAFALAVRVIQLVWALPGVLVPLLGAHLPNAAEREALETLDEPADVRDAVEPATPSDRAGEASASVVSGK